MLIAIVTNALVLIIPVAASGASLPLRDGEYAQEACGGGTPDVDKSFGVYRATESKHKVNWYLNPQVEGQDGGCLTGRIDARGNIYSGVAKCEDGGSRLRYSTGSYRFSLQIVNDRTFVSKGKKYVWCIPHR